MSSATSALREREHELGALRERLEGACAGEGTLLLVEGPAGIGKTELVREARAAALQASSHLPSGSCGSCWSP